MFGRLNLYDLFGYFLPGLVLLAAFLSCRACRRVSSSARRHC